MNTPALDKNTVLERARAAIHARTALIDQLYDAAEASRVAQAAATAAAQDADRAQAAHARAHQDALAAGWTEAELVASGLTSPPTRRTRKPTRTTPTRTRSRTPRRRVGADPTAASEHSAPPVVAAGERDLPTTATS